MKNVMNNSKKVFLMVALLATVMGYANDGTFFSVRSKANKTVLSLDVKVGNLFTIKDGNGITLYKEAIQQTGIYTKGFDLTSLPDGSYFFELEKDMEITTIPFTVAAKEVTFNKALSKTTFKPLTVVKKDYILVSQLSLEQKPLEVEIYYEDGSYTEPYQLMYSEKITNTKNIERVYKLSNFVKGKYKIVYKTDGREFVEFI